MTGLWKTVQNLSPEWQRDTLLDAIPALVRKYGNVAASAAVDWYEQTRAKQVQGDYHAQTAESFPDQGITDTIRWKAGELWNDPEAFASFVNGALSRWIQYSGRETIARNIRSDPAKPRWARVPHGSKTCAFCEMLCSRGWVYTSPEAAGNASNRFHPQDDCQIVPEWDRKNAHLKGYDPDAMYKRYKEARDHLDQNTVPEKLKADMLDEKLSVTEPNDERSLTWLMRHLHPGQYTDGVKPLSKPWPEDVKHISGKVWDHILIGNDGKGGHSARATVPGKSHFPEDWDDEQIKWAVKETIVNPDSVKKFGQREYRNKEFTDSTVLVDLIYSPKKGYTVRTAHPYEPPDSRKGGRA